MQDALVGTRLVHIRTPLERRLAADAIDLVWFPTYIEDVSLPFVCQVFDLEHRMKPWFPEVSAQANGSIASATTTDISARRRA